jgi:hypothetical protein
MTFAIEALLLSIPPTVHLGGSSDLGEIAGRSTSGNLTKVSGGFRASSPSHSERQKGWKISDGNLLKDNIYSFITPSDP